MKVSREQAGENRERILDAAAASFRARGFDGIGVADLMKKAGLTHGGFYGHFASKDDLIAQACRKAQSQSLARWQKRRSQAPREGKQSALKAIYSAYLSRRHILEPESGCLLPALGTEAPRQAPEVRQVVGDGVRAQIEFLTALIRDEGDQSAEKTNKNQSKKDRRQAIDLLASMVGGVILARAAADQKLAEEILSTVLTSLNEQF